MSLLENLNYYLKYIYSPQQWIYLSFKLTALVFVIACLYRCYAMYSGKKSKKPFWITLMTSCCFIFSLPLLLLCNLYLFTPAQSQNSILTTETKQLQPGYVSKKVDMLNSTDETSENKLILIKQNHKKILFSPLGGFDLTYPRMIQFSCADDGKGYKVVPQSKDYYPVADKAIVHNFKQLKTGSPVKLKTSKTVYKKGVWKINQVPLKGLNKTTLEITPK